MKFKVGESVTLIRQIESWLPEGTIGTVVQILDNSNIGVSFKGGNNYGHTCEDNCAQGSGWYIHTKDLYLTEPEIPLTPEQLEKERYDRVLKKIKHLDKQFETRQADKKNTIRIHKGNINATTIIYDEFNEASLDAAVQSLSLQNEQHLIHNAVYTATSFTTPTEF